MSGVTCHVSHVMSQKSFEQLVKVDFGGSDINGATLSSLIEYTDISRFYNCCWKFFFYLKVQCIEENTTTETNLSSPFYRRTYLV